MLTINAIRQTARGTPIWQPGAINLHVSVPCPLKVRLKEALGAFITDYNQRHERPLFCPSILDGIPHGTKKDIYGHLAGCKAKILIAV